MLTFTPPALYCPFPQFVNPHLQATHDHTVDWVFQYELFSPEARQRFPKAKYVHLVARTFPHAAKEALDLVADWNIWLFARDDTLVELGIGRDPRCVAAFNTRPLEILHGSRATSGDPLLVQALDDFCQRVRLRASPACLSRFIQTVEEHFSANIWEAAQYSENRIPDLSTYRMMRLFSGAVYTDLALIEIANAFELAPELHKHPLIHNLKLITNNVVCFSNDIFSLSREVAHGETINLVFVLQNEYGLSLQEAVDHAAEMHNAEVRAFEIMEAQLPACGMTITADVQRYIDGLRAWMQGNLDWSLTCGRYNLVPQMQEVAA